ncbi:MAG: hypothetical protein GDA46_03005 [Bdellovibrionales bacterium]|nr:hypothetical protein [Bdellovibrionales bacterium]
MDFTKIEEMARVAGEQNNCRVYDIYRHRDCLQIFIDKKKYAVSLEDCESVFHSLRFLLHSEMPEVLKNKRLEVSSPGLEKSLRKKWHFEECIGKTIKFITHNPMSIKNKKTGQIFQSQSLTGNLESIQKDCLKVKNSKIECSIPFFKIKSARLIFQFDKPKKVKKTR